MSVSLYPKSRWVNSATVWGETGFYWQRTVQTRASKCVGNHWWEFGDCKGDSWVRVLDPQNLWQQLDSVACMCNPVLRGCGGRLRWGSHTTWQPAGQLAWSSQCSCSDKRVSASNQVEGEHCFLKVALRPSQNWSRQGLTHVCTCTHIRPKYF